MNTRNSAWAPAGLLSTGWLAIGRFSQWLFSLVLPTQQDLREAGVDLGYPPE